MNIEDDSNTFGFFLLNSNAMGLFENYCVSYLCVYIWDVVLMLNDFLHVNSRCGRTTAACSHICHHRWYHRLLLVFGTDASGCCCSAHRCHRSFAAATIFHIGVVIFFLSFDCVTLSWLWVFIGKCFISDFQISFVSLAIQFCWQAQTNYRAQQSSRHSIRHPVDRHRRHGRQEGLDLWHGEFCRSARHRQRSPRQWPTLCQVGFNRHLFFSQMICWTERTKRFFFSFKVSSIQPLATPLATLHMTAASRTTFLFAWQTRTRSWWALCGQVYSEWLICSYYSCQGNSLFW